MDLLFVLFGVGKNIKTGCLGRWRDGEEDGSFVLCLTALEKLLQGSGARIVERCHHVGKVEH